MRDKHRYKLSKLPRNLCTSKKPMYFHGSPSWSRNFSYRFSWISISRSFDGHKEIVLVATTKPIEQGLALQLVHKQGM
uniref:Ribosomal protein S14 n=1 Tax=Corchorus capsularis TaxID=210143 RepID=A0A1C9I9P5_COCAP|nr:ribosomal protein S14 [Corchorus capsularis]AOO95930.1 ribosomal protein S14 [Corchorus capsularis]